MRICKHILFVLLALFLTLGLPFLHYRPAAGGVDAVARATMELPETPSGEFLVLINQERHPLTLSEWEDFFSERDVEVIMEDVGCLAADSDAAGVQMAERYQARLAENQMTLRRENGLLVVSRAERGLFDVVILSRELAEAYGLSPGPGTAVLTVGGPT